MGWFNKVLVVNDTTGDIQDITDLDKEHYESFLEAMQRLNIAYYNVLAREGKPVESSSNGLHKHDVNGSALLSSLLNRQREIISSPLRFNGVSNEDIIKTFAEHGIKYEQPF